MNLTAITDFFDRIAPCNRSADWDNDGIMLSCEGNNIRKILITLDVDSPATDKALECGADLIISHHPFIFRPIKRIGNDVQSCNIKKLIKNDISVLSYHTRMDASDSGINQFILTSLGASEVAPFGLDENDFTGRIGVFENKVTTEELYNRVKDLFGCKYFSSTLPPSSAIGKIAVVSGGGSEYAHAAEKLGADVFISGEFRHHQYIEHTENDFSVISIDHYHCENVFVKLTSQLLRSEFPDVEIIEHYGTQPFSDIII